MKRRSFLKLAGTTALGVVSTACSAQPVEPTAIPTTPPSPTPTATSAPILPTFAPTRIPSPTPIPPALIIKEGMLYQFNPTTLQYDEVVDDQSMPMKADTLLEDEENSVFFVISDGRVWEWKQDAGIKKAEVVGVLPDQIRIQTIALAKQLNSQGELVGQMYLGKDKKDRVMLLKPAKEAAWLVAPFGSSLKDGMWRVWNLHSDGSWQVMSIADAQSEMKKTERLESIANIVSEELSNEIKMGEAGFMSDVVSYGLEIKPGYADDMYNKLLDTMTAAVNPEIRKFWRELGFTGGTGEDLKLFLEKSVGGPENKPFWVPAKTKYGTEFPMLQALNPSGRDITYRPMKAVIENGGFYLDTLQLMFVSKKDWKNNELARGLAETVIRNNQSNPASYMYWNGAGYVHDCIKGFQLFNNRLLYMEVEVGTNSVAGFDDYMTLGGPELTKRIKDLSIASANYLNFLKQMREVYKLKYLQGICIHKLLDCFEVQIEVTKLTPEQILFEFVGGNDSPEIDQSTW